jgi:hypothetical protein
MEARLMIATFLGPALNVFTDTFGAESRFAVKRLAIGCLWALAAVSVSAAQNVVENPTTSQTITQPSGTDLSVVSLGLFTNMQGNDTLLGAVNGCNPGASFQGVQGNYYATAVDGCLTLPSSGVGAPDNFGVMGIVNNANSQSSVAAAGGYFQALATGSSSGLGVWGLNSLVTTSCSPSCTPQNIIGYEDDIGPGNTGTAAAQILGIQITGGSTGGTVPAGSNATAIIVEPTEPSTQNPTLTPWQWHYGVILGAGATDMAGVFLDGNIGAVNESTGMCYNKTQKVQNPRLNCPSQATVYQGWDSSGVNHDAEIWADPIGDLEVQPSPGRTAVVNGSLSVTGTKNFKIDHPLDPAHKYLYHTSVESPDMMNIYNGNVILDANGEAEVKLPAWFEALNKDFRYQLSCIGAFAPVYVSRKIENNSFRISGGMPGLEVSWQVTGIRHDAYAEAHPSPVEEEKPAAEHGHYLHPELFGVTEGQGANVARTSTLRPVTVTATTGRNPQ